MQRLTSLAPSKRPLTKTENIIAHFDDNEKKEYFSAAGRYADSKLIVNAFVRGLATRVSADEVIVNNFCPGMVGSTGMAKNSPLWIRAIARVVQAMRARSPEEGTRTMVYAVAVAGKGSHGKLLESNKVNP
jgi:NAD(P)-dependent dehydrogenase (short-subunit alcohol dehydrogenase family)